MKESTKRIKRDCEALRRAYYADRRGDLVIDDGLEAVMEYGDMYLKPLLLLHNEAETKAAHDTISAYVAEILDSTCDRMDKCEKE